MKYLKTKLENRKVIPFFKSKIKLTTVSCCIAFMALTSCGGSDDGPAKADCANGAWIQSVETELNSWVAATQAYGADATSENCQKYKSAGQAYINALDKIKECVPTISIANFEEALEEAKESLSEIPC